MASSRVRGVELARALRSLGVPATVAHAGQQAYRTRFLWLGMISSTAVFQKRSSPNDRRLARLRRLLGLTSVFDLDDIPGGVPHDQAEEDRVIRMMHTVSAVTVGGHLLRDFARRHNPCVEIVPSAVDCDLFSPVSRRRPSDPVSIGWIGDGRVYWQDLLPLAGTLSRLRRRREVRMIIVGAMGQEQLYSTFCNRDDRIVDSLKWTDSSASARALSDLDIGVYPLRANPTNEFKCGYKALQYMAMGLPVVASPIGEIPHIVVPEKTGFLAASDEQWYESLRCLMEDPERRASMGQAGRLIASSRYSTRVAAEKLLSLLQVLSRSGP